MTQEDKQLLFKDLCARLPYGVTCHANEINLDGDLLFINKVYKTVALYNDKAIGKFDTCPIDDVKPYLRPMSLMTEEELHEYNMHLFGITTGVDAMNFMIWIYQHHLDILHLIEKGLALEASEEMYKIK